MDWSSSPSSLSVVLDDCCLRVVPTGMVGSRCRAAERSTTLMGDFWERMGRGRG